MRKIVLPLAFLALLAIVIGASLREYELDTTDFDRNYKAPRREVAPIVSPIIDFERSAKVVEREPDLTEIPDPKGIEKLQAYVFGAMRRWKKELPSLSGLYQDIAHDIAWASLVRDKIWSDDDDRHKAAIYLATLALFEGAFLPFVDDGSCNIEAWRKKAWNEGKIWGPNICDGGTSWTLWQIKPETGIKLTDNGEWVYDKNGIGGKQLVDNRKLATLVAHAFVKKSVRITHGLCGYTGDVGCSKATLRSEFAKKHLRSHPF